MRTKIFNRVPATDAVPVFVGLLAGASSSDADPTAESRADTSPSDTTAEGTTAMTAPNTSATAPSQAGRTEAAILRFTGGATQVDMTVTDNPTTRDLTSMLPLTLTFEEFNGREKIAYLPETLDTQGSSGTEPENDDLIYYAPWGNLGFYYNADGVQYSDQVIHIGDYTATLEQPERLQNGEVTVELIDAAGV